MEAPFDRLLHMAKFIQIWFSKWWKNDKRNSNPFFKVMRTRKTKTEIDIRFSKWCENEIRSSKPFFKVRRKRKTKSKIQIWFSMPCENEKWIWHLNSFFPCHRKTVGTKVHALFMLNVMYDLEYDRDACWIWLIFMSWMRMWSLNVIVILECDQILFLNFAPFGFPYTIE